VEEAAIGEQQFQVRLTDRQPEEMEDVDEVANITVKSLWRTVPAAVPGLHFCPGGQSAELASARLKYHECPVQVEIALGAVIFVCPRHPATSFGNLAGRRGQRKSGAASFASSGKMQPCRPPWRIHRRDGKNMSMATCISE